MAPHRTSWLGSIFAVLALVVSSGLVGVRPHGMHEHDMSAEHRAPVAFAAAAPSAPVAMQHGAAPHRGHPMGGGATCPCAGACLDGIPVMLAAEAPTLLESPPESEETVLPEPALPVRGDPTAYLRPLPNAPPLA
jgi:hypothetical protein